MEKGVDFVLRIRYGYDFFLGVNMSSQHQVAGAREKRCNIWEIVSHCLARRTRDVNIAGSIWRKAKGEKSLTLNQGDLSKTLPPLTRSL